MPPELKGSSNRSRAARAAWEAMRAVGDEAAVTEQRFGVSSLEARRARTEARQAQERLLIELGVQREDVVAQFSRGSQRGLDAIALLRY
jgi:hypothetical protein